MNKKLIETLVKNLQRKNHLKKWQEHYLPGNHFVGGLLIVKENTMAEKEINKLGEEYALNSTKFEENQNRPQNCRIRKLTPKEYWRLMGVKDEDYEKVAKNQSRSSLYHLAGDSIVTTVLMAIFGQMFDVDWKTKINELAKELTNERKSERD